MSDPRPIPRLRGALAAVPRYRAGRAATTSQPDLVPYTLASNENPFPPLPGVLAAVADAASRVNRYPDFGASALLAALSAHHDRPAASICVGTGSVALLQHVLQIACDDGDDVIYGWRSFEAYPILTRITGGHPIEVPLTSSGDHDLPAMAAAVTDRTRVVVVCSPNNPTGTAVTTHDFVAFMAQVPPHVLVVLDEAYREFVTDPRMVNGLEHLDQYPNLIVLRTFSKAYGLAGLRVGVAVADVDIADAIRAVATPFGVSGVAQAAAVASLAPAAQQLLADQVTALTAARTRLSQDLTSLGVDHPEPHGNFVWLPVGAQATSIGARLAEQAVSVRVFDGEGIRVTVGAQPAHDRLLRVLSASLTP